MRPKLTPHQAEVYGRIVDEHYRIKAAYARIGINITRPPSFTARQRPDRLYTACVAAGVMGPQAVGSAGALAHLTEKGYLRVAVDDRTCPIYVLKED